MATNKKKKRRQRIGYSRKIYTRPMFEEIAGTQLYFEEFNDAMLAYRLAKYGHKGQTRRDNWTRYFDHCKSVALIIMLEFKVFLGFIIITALMHDLGEDSYILSWRDIEKIFGKNVYRGLRVITKERGKDYDWGIKSVVSRDWWILLVKFADRLHNIRNILDESRAFRLKQLRETEAIYPELLRLFAKKIPKRFAYLPAYICVELEYACDKIRKSLGLPKSTVFSALDFYPGRFCITTKRILLVRSGRNRNEYSFSSCSLYASQCS